MPIIIPVSVNYPSPLQFIPSQSQDEPTEGRQQVPIEINWGTMGGAAKCVSLNLASAPQPITQISMLKIDNSACGADVQFIFPDTNEIIDIDAGTPYALVEVLSNSKNFYVTSANSLVGDTTRFTILNYHTDPVALTDTPAQSFTSSGALALGTVTNTSQIVPAAITGTLKTLYMMLTRNATPVTKEQYVVTIQDGATNKLIDQWNITTDTSDFVSIPVFNFANLNWRFRAGITMSWQPTLGGGGCIGNVLTSYTTP